MAQIRAFLVLFSFVLLTLMLAPFQFLARQGGSDLGRLILPHYYRAVCWILGIKVNVLGHLVRDKPLLIAANHTSYLDIIVLGSVGKLAFIAKSEVKDWPFFGQMAILARTVFVERERRSKTGEHRDMIHRRLAEGDTLVLFPEGTTGDGNNVLSFKSALMGAAQVRKPTKDDDPDLPPILVQPVAVTYRKLHGVPMGRQFRPFFAWYGDMELLPHLWEAFCLGPIDVDIHFYEPVTLSQFRSRKEMTQYCENVVRAGVGHALAGRAGIADALHEIDGPVPRGAEPEPQPAE